MICRVKFGAGVVLAPPFFNGLDLATTRPSKASFLDIHPHAVGILSYKSSMKVSTRSRKSVAFTLDPQIRTIALRPRRRRRISNMEKTVYEAFHSDEGITDELLQEAARLFLRTTESGISRRHRWWGLLRKQVALP